MQVMLDIAMTCIGLLTIWNFNLEKKIKELSR